MYEKLRKKYRLEFQKINNRLNDLEQNRIYEVTGAKMDGSLNTNIIKLKEDLNELFHMIENDLDSASDIIFKK